MTPRSKPVVSLASPQAQAATVWPSGDVTERQAIIHGLSQVKPTISPKYFYDERGSALFETITRLPEYYVTRVEQSIFERHGNSIAASVGADSVVIEPGAGNCEKARALCDRLHSTEFVGIDISTEHLQEAAKRLSDVLPWLRVRAIAGDITEPIRLPEDLPRRNRLVFYPGSSIGNFEPAQAVHLLSQMRAMLGEASDGGSLLIGIDLPKPVHILQAAYDDASGVTAAFNRNALDHVNRLIGSDFDSQHWKHRAFFNAECSRVEMHLVALHDMRVSWPGGGREFSMGERIHTENSYKYSLDVFAALLREAGFGQYQSWTDDQDWFAVIHARP
ncbi:L-histidine N(alpha)-methyltransferase [Diaphorobacter aerolatus]|uniref:L-histidine N(Alpha)-methyltransferase n=2 Tax=Diaphorobacter aerolatus TaxID=1288495 RepID=A0A7H0GPX5_9BURK|nr:L-histidine N(alpha)-methyltransferase [Diaphorobacter aerolatus]